MINLRRYPIPRKQLHVDHPVTGITLSSHLPFSSHQVLQSLLAPTHRLELHFDPYSSDVPVSFFPLSPFYSSIRFDGRGFYTRPRSGEPFHCYLLRSPMSWCHLRNQIIQSRSHRTRCMRTEMKEVMKVSLRNQIMESHSHRRRCMRTVWGILCQTSNEKGNMLGNSERHSEHIMFLCF